MMSRLFSFGQSTRTEARRPTGQDTTFRPKLEQLEEREVPSANPLDALLGSSPGIVPIQVNSVTNGAPSPGQIPFTANGQVGVNPLPVPITGTITATPSSTGGTPILDLHINPIHLDVLGLNVQTSSICLDITAQHGGLLGNLLNNLTNALGSGSTNPLGSLNPIESLLLPLEEATLINGALDAATSASALGSSSAASSDGVLPPGANDILHLSLGPVNLNLLGLNVNLNNCANPAGPVVVDVYTVPGENGLLGNLLNDVSNLLNSSTLGASTSQQLLGSITHTLLETV